MASATTPKALGTAAVGSETAKFARGDHVHPTTTATASVLGMVKLSDSTSSTSAASAGVAASPKAVKAAYDAATAAQTAADAAQIAASNAQTAADAAQIAAANAVFPSGTKMLFNQPAAPTGWTKQTSVDNAALRVVSGDTGGGTGGSIAFSTLFATGKAVSLSGTVGATTLTVAQMPSHTHPLNAGNSSEGNYNSFVKNGRSTSLSTGSTGGSSSHTHTLSGTATIALNVKYTDVIICSKD